MGNQGTAYLGLFLIAFSLYAAQLKKTPISASATEVRAQAPGAEPTPVQPPQARIQVLYDLLTSDNRFTNKIDGVRVSPVKNDFTVTLIGDEIYTDGGFSVNDSWNSILDKLAVILKSEKGLMIEISGYADEDNLKEKQPGDYGSSAFAFSYARAEWLAHYFERKHGIPIKKTFILRGLGSVPQGKKIEMRFYFSSAFSGELRSGAS